RDPQQVLQRVPALSGALLMMPRALFDRIGGWDAGYRLHAEDLDLCRRAREAGAVVAIANDLQVTHVRGVSSRSRPFFVEWHKHRGLWRYFQKFEARQRSLPVRVAVWAAIWGHALMLVPRLLRRSL
ncbi:MAG: glycosyltransferase, partial [Pseudomonadota bacterium]